MLYIVITIFFLVWAILVTRKGHLSWHSLISVYLVAVYVSDIGDVTFDHFLNLYDLHARLLSNLYSDQWLGIIFSDGIIFPLIAIVFCYYSVQYHRPWLLSIIFALLMGIIELTIKNLGFMVYHQWNYWLTPALTFIAFRILAHFASRLIYYSPPISYRFWLACLVYSFTEWPSGIMSWGIMHLYQYRPHIFEQYIADDRFIELMHGYVVGGVAAYFAPKIRQQNKLFLFLGLGVCSVVYVLYMYEIGWLTYYRWNHGLTIIRYLTPYLLIYWCDRWESSFLTTKDDHNNPSKKNQ